MKSKQQVWTRKKSFLKVGKSANRKISKQIWNQLQVLTRKHVANIDVLRLMRQFNVGLNSLLKMEFPSVKVYVKRTQRKIDRFFIRQNRLRLNETPRKIDISARLVT